MRKMRKMRKSAKSKKGRKNKRQRPLLSENAALVTSFHFLGAGSLELQEHCPLETLLL